MYRVAGYRRGLVVLATGLGNTWLATFDVQQLKAKRVLFVAHREEILMQAEDTFSRIQPAASVGYYTGKEKQAEADFVFASVQTLGRGKHLQQFSPDCFDYIVVDEFHHANAITYRRLINFFQPRFMLGLTATPERTDQADILSLCDDNLVFERNFVEGINAELLCPFHYHGIHDKTVNYAEIPWRNGRFDPHDLSNKLATLARAKHALLMWEKLHQSRTLAFCVSHVHRLAKESDNRGKSRALAEPVSKKRPSYRFSSTDCLIETNSSGKHCTSSSTICFGGRLRINPIGSTLAISNCV